MHTAWIVVATLIVVALLNFAAWAVLRSQGYGLGLVRTSSSTSTSPS